jgi:predicted nucleotidyltransferase component of viral defense system
LNAPDKGLIARAAGALGVDESFVEKDWFVVQAVARLVAVGNDDLAPVFSGGTSLLKGYGLIKRFSEDIDFKLAVSPAFSSLNRSQRSKRLSSFKQSLVEVWTAAGFEVTNVQAGNENAFIKIELDYPTLFPDHSSLRPHILAEITARPPRFPSIAKPIASFVSQFEGRNPELSLVPCVDPVETAADKLSALAWRTIARDRSAVGDDATIVRHVYDLATLMPLAGATPGFARLAAQVMAEDGARGGGAAADLGPTHRVQAMLGRLRDDPLYRVEYQQFAEGMIFAGQDETLSFDAALEGVETLCELIQ